MKKHIMKFIEILSSIFFITGIFITFYYTFKYFNTMKLKLIIYHFDEVIAKPLPFFIISIILLLINNMLKKKWR